MLGELLLAGFTFACIAYFLYIQNYISDPHKKAKDEAWRTEWEPLNRRRQRENERRRQSLDGMFQRESLKIY